MKTVKTMQFWVSLLTIQAFLLNPLVTPRAAANPVDDFHKTCDQVYKSSDSKSPSATGLQTRGECDKAKMAVRVRKAEQEKMIMFGAAGAAMVGLALTEFWDGGISIKICNGLSSVTSFTSSGMDYLNKKENEQVLEQYQRDAQKFVGAAVAMGSGGLLVKQDSLLGSLIGKKGFFLKNEIAKHSDEKGPMKRTCLLESVAMGTLFGISSLGLKAANKSISLTVAEAAKGIELAKNGGAQSLNFQNTREVASAPIAEHIGSNLESECASVSGNAHLKCVAEGSNSAELTALTNNQPFLDHLQKALGGKSPGDFAKDFKGETKQDAANYIANGLGMGPNGGEAMAKLMDAQSKLAHDTGAADKYDPMNYARTGSAPTIKGDDNQDFAKMMGDMMNKLNPDGSPANGKDPSELVFRQLDLLSPEKIEQNKEISLFARIGYRYRKKASDVEQLNWASEQNRAVASDPSAQKKQ